MQGGEAGSNTIVYVRRGQTIVPAVLLELDAAEGEYRVEVAG